MPQPASRCAFAVLVWALSLVPLPASADVFAAPFAGVKFGGYTSIVDLELAAGKTSGTIGASLFLLDEGIIGYEVTFAHVPRYFELGNSGLITPGSFVIDLTGNVIVALPPNVTRGGLRPYVIGGLGLVYAKASDVLGIFQVRRTVPAISVGAGAIGLLTVNVGVRFDLRYIRSLTREDDRSLATVGRRISYSRGTVGLVLRF